MAITTYAQLQTAVANWVHRADLTSMIPDFITLGELRIFREVRCRVMEATLSGTIASGVVALPSDYLELKLAYLNGAPKHKLTGASASQIYDKYPLRASDGIPVLIGREGSNFIFGPYPDSTYTLSGTYYAQPTSIATSANALFLANPDLYLFAALCESAPYTKSDNAAVWEAKYASIVANLERESSTEEGSGGGMRIVAK